MVWDNLVQQSYISVLLEIWYSDVGLLSFLITVVAVVAMLVFVFFSPKQQGKKKIVNVVFLFLLGCISVFYLYLFREISINPDISLTTGKLQQLNMADFQQVIRFLHFWAALGMLLCSLNATMALHSFVTQVMQD